MRPSKTVAGAVLSAVLALAALPGLAGSRSLDPDQILDPAAFQSVILGASPSRSTAAGPLDPALRSDGSVGDDGQFQEPGQPKSVPSKGATPKLPAGKSIFAWKDPLYTLSGDATWYDAGYTAMRLPRGTVIVVCGKAGCLERVVTDYGPVSASRVIDLYKPDFYTICGCASWEGVTPVTVRVYS